jgi:hypothetical protein
MANKPIKDESISYFIMGRMSAVGRGKPFWLDEICIPLNNKDPKYKKSEIKKELEKLATDDFIIKIKDDFYADPDDAPPHIRPFMKFSPLYIEDIASSYQRPKGYSIGFGGAQVVNLMGLSTQVPVQVVYSTDGPSELVSFHTGREYHTEVRFSNIDYRVFNLELGLRNIVLALLYLENDIDKKVMRRIKEISSYSTYITLMSLEFLPPSTKKLLRKYA